MKSQLLVTKSGYMFGTAQPIAGWTFFGSIHRSHIFFLAGCGGLPQETKSTNKKMQRFPVFLCPLDPLHLKRPGTLM